MPQRILWLDNDPAYLEPFVEALTDDGYEVEVIATVAEAENALHSAKYDLFILDVMIPTVNADEEKRFDPSVTQLGNQTGLVFYKLNKDLIDGSGTKMLVMTVRLDKSIMDEFVSAGLPADRFATKYDLRDSGVFLAKIHSALTESNPQSAQLH